MSLTSSFQSTTRADVTQADYQLLVETWNQTEVPFPKEIAIQELFEQIAETHGEAMALIWRDQSYTYRQLRNRVANLAAELNQLGVEPEVRVGICMSRCPDMVIAMLAVLWAGGAYVPMDPNYPVERLAFIMEDADAPILISQSRWAHLLSQTSAKMIKLDSGWHFHARETASFKPKLPLQTAYVLFTSGSTGRPKGVQIGHRSVVAMLDWAAREFPLEQRKAVLAATSICFDLSVFEIFLPLTTGSTVVLAENALDLANITHPVTLVNTVPSAMTELCRGNQIPPSTKVINLAGEPLRGDLVAALYAIPTIEKVYNLYGPSEDTTYSTWTCIPKQTDRPPAIGRPLANTQAFVLNEKGLLVKPETEGELYLAGDGLARGYLNQAAMTAERFLPNPFTKQPGGRMYKTGDLVRHFPTGDLNFLGRLDHQVKIRGFRIELGEIEAHLRRHSAVADAVVMAIKQSGDPQLAAYVVRKNCELDDTILRQNLRAHLGAHLPGYMVPAFIVPMDVLPQTPNGKLDRKALPQPGQVDQGRTIAPPRNHQELQLATIWGDALGFEEVGVFEDFFDLGGDSIRALRIVTQARNAGLPLKTIDLFRQRTIAALVEYLPQTTTSITTSLDASMDKQSEWPVSMEIRHQFPSVEAIWPATAMQESMLFQSQLSGNPTDYADVFHFTLKGQIDEKRFEQVWRQLTQRHFALRTVFRHQDETTQQIVLKQGQPDFEYIPEACYPYDDPSLQSFISKALKGGFHPAEKPPWRIFLLKESAQRCHFIFMFHHVILDGWSLAVLFRECGILQTAPILETALPATAPFQRFLNWLANWDQAAGKAYWAKRMAGFNEINAVLPLPKPEGKMVRQMDKLRLSRATTGQIRQFARKQGLTLNTLVQGAWALIISRYSRSSDVVFGNSTSGRSPEIPGVETIAGLLLQTVVSRIRTDSTEPIIPWLHQIQKRHHHDEQHAFYPLVNLQRALGATNQKPLFETMIAFENYAGGDWPKDEWAGAQLEGIQEREDIHYGLFLQVLPEPVITLKLHSDKRRFEKGGSTRLLDQVAHVLQAMTLMSDCRPCELPILPANQKKILHALHKISAPPYRPRTIVTEFEKQCAKNPDAIAVVSQADHLSYSALNRSADHFANHLLARGLRPEEPVGICLERNHFLIVAYFGVLKAGGVILPIDPNYPDSRKTLLAEDAGIRILIGTCEIWPNGPQSPTILAPNLALKDRKPIAKPTLWPDQLAYIIYTSGSSGKPKGAAISHGAYVNQAEGCIGLLEFDQDDRVLQFSSHSFDLSINEIFKILFVGGALVIERHRHGLAPDALHRLSAQQHLTILELPTGFWRTFCEQSSHAGMRLPPHVRLLVAGGERVLPENLAHWAKTVAPTSKFGNCYGPTETTVTATWRIYEASQISDGLPGEVPIGSSLPRYEMHLLSQTGRSTPLGAAGELFIGGPGLARGYFGRPALTAASFVPHHDCQQPGARLYRTGDLIRFNGDSELMFVDRIDRQVKIRGFRVELGEIEYVLRQHDQVANAVVLSQADPAGGQRLAAFVVPKLAGNHPNPLTAKSIHAFLDGRMPHFMLPNAYALLAKFPLTLNGKLNKAALPDPNELNDPSEEGITPQNQTQIIIAEIWREVLALKKVSIQDNFFDLGGHSLSALAVHQKLQRAFDRRLPLVKIFEHPNIARLAAYLDKNDTIAPDQPLAEMTDSRVANRKQALRNRRRR